MIAGPVLIPAAARLRRRVEINTTVRRGVSCRGRHLVVHFLADVTDVGSRRAPTGPRVAFAVGRGVGGSVVRHRITRQLRSCMRERLSLLPAGSTLVVRARPTVVGCTTADLGKELDGLLARVLTRSASATGAGGGS